MRRRDWVLLVTAAADGEPLSAVQLQKVLFLIGKDLDHQVGEHYYDFRPFHYGPYAVAVYEDATRLNQEGLVLVAAASQGRWNEYQATPNGTRVAATLLQSLPKSDADRIRALVKWARSLSFEDLLRAVYTKYPEMRVNSRFRGNAETERIDRPRTPEAEWFARRAEHVRQQARYDYALYQVNRARERGRNDWVTFDEVDQDYPSEE